MKTNISTADGASVPTSRTTQNRESTLNEWRGTVTGAGVKRAFDIILSLLGLIVISPLLLGISLWVYLTSPGGVFYRGLRVGRHSRPFRIYKFRTMVPDAERRGGSCTADDDPRITRAGRFLRKYKLDELPQLLNVLFGDMSFVGPRPEVQRYVDKYTEVQRVLLHLRPGITDWASIWNVDEGSVLASAPDPEHAYEELILPTKIQLQLKYFHELSLWTDIKILFYTGLRLLRKDWRPIELAVYPVLRPAQPSTDLTGLQPEKSIESSTVDRSSPG